MVQAVKMGAGVSLSRRRHRRRVGSQVLDPHQFFDEAHRNLSRRPIAMLGDEDVESITGPRFLRSMQQQHGVGIGLDSWSEPPLGPSLRGSEVNLPDLPDSPDDVPEHSAMLFGRWRRGRCSGSLLLLQQLQDQLAHFLIASPPTTLGAGVVAVTTVSQVVAPTGVNHRRQRGVSNSRSLRDVASSHRTDTLTESVSPSKGRWLGHGFTSQSSMTFLPG